MNKIHLFSHNDLDGISPAILAKLAFKDRDFEASCVGVKHIDQVVSEFLEAHEETDIDLYITDISVNDEVAALLQERIEKGQKVTLLDHHASALPLAEKYEWAHIVPTYEDGTKTAATTLFYDYLVENDYLAKTAALDDYVELVRQFDTWDWFEKDNQRAKQLNNLYYLISRDEFQDTILETLEASLQDESVTAFAFSERHQILLEVEEKKIEKYLHDKEKQLIKASVNLHGTEYYVGVVFAENYQSELGNYLCLQHDDINFSVLVDMGRQKMGLRTVKDEYNLSKIAGELGGGGHPRASGCSLTPEAFELFVQNLLFKEAE
ncbi:DHH family phosphoesterase [Priestia koreensis]|uniref:Phosphoesterase n=1 Tax=Priestia koreensis TaxID=284581 RepID=A0A0M0L9R0_9BACI|nr:DHHA1 domain-containing protein [Priestia koreensis]KOO47592.1 phosphoesterase [Priestia koreensis]